MTEFLKTLSKTELVRVKHLKKTHPIVRKHLHRVRVDDFLKVKLKERPTVKFKRWSKKKVKRLSN